MVECQLPKLNTGVRFPSPAPARRKRHIVCDEFFQFHYKAHRAPILLLLASKPDLLPLRSGLAPPCGGFGLTSPRLYFIMGT